MMDLPIAENGMTGVANRRGHGRDEADICAYENGFPAYVHGPDSQPRCQVVLYDRRQDECAIGYKEHHRQGLGFGSAAFTGASRRSSCIFPGLRL